VTFVLDVHTVQATETKFRKIYNALLLYRDLHGTVSVPPTFVVPSTPDWPQDWWKLRVRMCSTAAALTVVLLLIV
jgi:hypothetical protein